MHDDSQPTRRSGAIAFAVALLGLLVLRFLARRAWHVPAGDGLQYFQLAHELWAHQRFAFAPPPAPLAFSRLPGYPLFIALLGSPTDMESHLVRATILNQLLDLTSAACMAGIALERGLGRAVAAVAALLVLACPIVLFLSCYGLTESLVTCLLAVELYLAVRAMRRASPALAALSGAAAGLAQLVRPDAVALVPAALAALLLAREPIRRRARAVAAYAVAAAIAFSPWPIRNLIHFGAPHATGSSSWEKQDGSEMPTGMLRWMRTWCTGSKGETYLVLLVAYNRPVDLPRNLRPDMYDDDDEKARVVAAFERYNRSLRLGDAEEAFLALAADRARRTPLRTFVGLPVKRMIAEWSHIPEWELPMRVPLLGLPAGRAIYGGAEGVLFAIAVLGAALLWWRDRRLLAVIGLAVVARTVLFAYGIPFPVERYMVEAVPPLLLCAAFAIVGAVAAAGARARRARDPATGDDLARSARRGGISRP